MTGTADDTMPMGTMSTAPQVLLAHHLKQLKLPTVLREYDKVARECARDGTDHPRYLLRLIELELIDRERRTIERRIRAARFPAVKSFDTFDFAAIPSLNKMLVLELARCEYVLRRENVHRARQQRHRQVPCRARARPCRLPERADGCVHTPLRRWSTSSWKRVTNAACSSSSATLQR